MDLVARLKKRGMSVALRGGKLRITPSNLLTDTDKKALTAHKQEIVGYLASLPKDPALPILEGLGIQVHYIHSETGAGQIIAGLLTNPPDWLGLDIETYGPAVIQGEGKQRKVFHGGLDANLGSIRTIQIATDQKAWVFDLHWINPDLFRPLLVSTIRFAAFNAGFEYQWLKSLDMAPVNLDCVMLMARVADGLVYPQKSFPSLAAASARYLGLEVDKTYQLSDWGIDEQLDNAEVHYAALDAVLALRLVPILLEKLAEPGQTRYYDLVRDTLPAVNSIMLDGIGFAADVHADLLEVWEGEKEAARREVIRSIPEIKNPGSSTQIGAWLEKVLPAETKAKWPRTDTGRLQTGSEALSNWPDCPPALVKLKSLGNLTTTFGQAFANSIHPVTGRLHGNFKLAGTETGRFSCGSPNVQNPPRRKDFRDLFIADHGNVLVAADFSQIELRIVAMVADDQRMIQAYRDGVDLHRLTGATADGIDMADVTGDQRQAAKALNFGLIYGMSAKTLPEYAWANYRVRMTEREAVAFHGAFFGLYRGLARWHTQIKQRGLNSQVVRTPTGLVRDMGREGGWGFTRAANTPVQGGGAEVLLASLRNVHAALEGKHARIVNHVHDEILVECPGDEVEEVANLLKQGMIDGFLEIFPGREDMTRDLIDVKVGRSWAEVK